jgi:hypothetical protein
MRALPLLHLRHLHRREHSSSRRWWSQDLTAAVEEETDTNSRTTAAVLFPKEVPPETAPEKSGWLLPRQPQERR